MTPSAAAPSSPLPILNLAGYRFTHLDQPAEMRDRLLALAGAAGLRGTILLAHEGINFFLAGEPTQARRFLAELRQEPAFAGLEAKESWSPEPPFRKLLVKVRREIVRMNHPTIAPQRGRAPAVDASTAKRWLDQGRDDQGRPVVTLDTRNVFEVDYGTFDQAIDWRLERFSDFPQALREHMHELEGKTVVSFCTGGIRCEKAVLYMREAGLQNVFQLDGGILRYFEETGSEHFNGNCFVFDEREALDARLIPAKREADDASPADRA